MFTRSLLAFGVIALLNGPASIWAQTANERFATYDLPSGQRIRMDLSAGEYTIEGSPDERIRVQWSSSDPKKLDNVKVRFTTERSSVTLETDHTKKTRVVIYVPARSDLHVRLCAGELSVSGIEGHKDIALSAGELHVAVGDPVVYRDVRSSVRIGEINAEPFHIKKGGFFRGFKATGEGNYLLRARVGVGEVTLAR